MNKSKYVIVFSHSNYLIKASGTEKAIRDIAEISKKEGIHMLQIFSFYNKLTNKLSKKQYVGVNLDEQFLGIYYLSDILSLINQINKEKNMNPIGIHIHHLLNYRINELSQVISNLKLPTVLFIHDYFTICKSENLINSNGEFCGFSFPSSTKCVECDFYNKARLNRKQIEIFLEKVSYSIRTIIVPSKFVYDRWTKLYNKYSDKVIIRPHLSFEGEYHKEMITNRKIRIAFVGGQFINKGYNEWKEFIKTMKDYNEFYEFYYFGSGSEKIDGVKNIRVTTIKNGNDMTEALRQYNIDYVFLWSMCAETYSYVYFEASAADTCIITNPNSGNINKMVNKNKNGIIFEDINGVSNFFRDNIKSREFIKIFNKNNEFRPFNCKINESIDGIIFKEVNCKLDLKSKSVKRKEFMTRLYERKNLKN